MRTERGATLMELLVTLGIIAVLGGMSVLGSQQLSTSYRVRSAARDIMGDLQFARLSAIKEGRTYTVCFTPGDNVVTSYLITNDPAACASVNPPIRTTTISGVTAVENFAGTSVAFAAQGTVSGGGGTMAVTSLNGARTVTVALGPAGNPRVQ